ncbi:39S ribosomal protein L9, mitochondrial isoform X2 [Grammomys surdaster]|uniref:39S ribosomal protein L9, mitochondrial isoform X2 n=1 Tax=Grammomys surdaster TaxID=491861 RepID=UPI00109FD13A|nr:39S ribosomal protein L9, mitochondrial isoform X2 [Grammomys surdaster]
MAASVVPGGKALLWAGAAWLRQRGIGELLRPRIEGSTPGRDFSLSHYQSTVIVERWWKVPLAGEGRKPRLHRRHRVYKLVEDTKRRPKDNLELILTQSVYEIGVRGDLVSVKKSVGRNKLLPQGLAVYASPENRKLFEEEKALRQEGKLEKIQTKAGEAKQQDKLPCEVLKTSFFCIRAEKNDCPGFSHQCCHLLQLQDSAISEKLSSRGGNEEQCPLGTKP